MAILNRIFGSKKTPTKPDGQPQSARSLMKARTPPWHKVPPIVIDAIFEALDATELFDCFVLSSIENNLVSRYEQLGQELDLLIIRARISDILCQTGFKRIAVLVTEFENNHIEAAKKSGFEATNLFEPAIAFSRNQIIGYLGMSTIYAVFGIKSQCQAYAERGLSELQKIKQSTAGQAIRDSAIFPPDIIDQAERQLRGYLE